MSLSSIQAALQSERWETARRVALDDIVLQAKGEIRIGLDLRVVSRGPAICVQVHLDQTLMISADGGGVCSVTHGGEVKKIILSGESSRMEWSNVVQ